MAKISVKTLQEMKIRGIKIAAATAHDASIALLLDKNGIEVILVGDSLGMVVQGHDSTLPVKMEHMIYHTCCVAKTNKNALVIADMPFGSYTSNANAIENAVLLIQSGANMIKLEGGRELQEIVKQLKLLGIPVCIHLGLLPQSINTMGGYYVQGRTEEAAKKISEDAEILVNAGAQLAVLECIPESLASDMSKLLKIPTIGIGSGKFTDGQILVTYDLLGLSNNNYKFCKSYADLIPSEAIKSYVKEVKEISFPSKDHILA
ncbi:MAG: 3-methyl-2-oxobutanoate hydroxymethyltransferase [Pseudomonadota bacterium]|nr:3-methyl-2-oxobutanoate hydroxymethyltransferase [Pseudomonadota bacterium]